MEFSQSLILGDSTLENIKFEENIAENVNNNHNNSNKIFKTNNYDDTDSIVDESPTNNNKLNGNDLLHLHNNKKGNRKRRPIIAFTQMIHKSNSISSSASPPQKKSTILVPKINENNNNNLLCDEADVNNFSKFFNSSLEIVENNNISTNKNDSIKIIEIEKLSNCNNSLNTEEKNRIIEIFDDSGGYSEFLSSNVSKIKLNQNENNNQNLEITKNVIRFDGLIEEQKSDKIKNEDDVLLNNDFIIENVESFEEQQITENGNAVNNDDDDNEYVILNVENTSFITMNLNNKCNNYDVNDANDDDDDDERDKFIKSELENSKKDLNENLIINNNNNNSSSLLHFDNSSLNNSKQSVSESESIRLNWSSSANEIISINASQHIAIANHIDNDHNDTNGNEVSDNNQQKININSFKDISSWNLPKEIQKQYKKKGINEMFDWQVECLTISKVLLEQGNLVYSAPTSAGKTLVSEILMIKTILERRKKALIILPFISVVREKMYYLQNLLNSSGIRVEGFFGGYSPPGGFDSINVAICTIEKANSIVNRLLEQNKLNDIGIVIMDEIHLISDTNRGYIIELLLSKILYMCYKYDYINIQIIAMSATLSNINLLKKWLRSDLYMTTYRPVNLNEMIKIGTKLYDNKMNIIRDIYNDDNNEIIKNLLKQFNSIKNDNHDNIIELCLETIFEECSIIIFCPTKDWCEKLCLHIANIIYLIIYKKSNTNFENKLKEFIKKDKLEEIKMQLKNIPTGLDSILEKTITYGCAFHHAGLTVEERDLIETSFRNGIIKVIVATSTLSSGVNLPARRVIIRTPLFGGKKMDPLTYKQMIGRAGRTGKDTTGESILICNENNSKIGKELICSDLKPLKSCLDYENSIHLKRAILEVISSGVAKTKQDIELFLSCTLMYAQNIIENESVQHENTNNDEMIDKSQSNCINDCMKFLIEYEFIRIQTNDETNEQYYVPTRLGLACLSASMPPTDGIILLSELQKSRRCFVLESELHAIYLVTPYSVCYQLQNIDWLSYLDIFEKLSVAEKKVGELIGIKESFLIKAMRGQNKLDYKLLQIHKRFYIAMALQELVNEITINQVANKYNLSRGLLQSLQQMSSTFAGIVTSFCNSLNWRLLSLIVSQFKERLYFGIQNDLIDLIRLPDLNCQRARILYNSGIHTIIDLAKSNYIDIEKILYNCISFDLIKKKDDEDEYDAKKRNEMRNLYVTGKEGLTIKEAAKLLITDARKYLELEMGAKNINWEYLQNNEEQKNTNMNENDSKNSGGSSSSRSILTTSTPVQIQINNNKECLEVCRDLNYRSTENAIEKNPEIVKKESDTNKMKNNLKEINNSNIMKISKNHREITDNKNSKIKTKNLDLLLVPGMEQKRKSRNSMGNKSLEEIQNSQPENIEIPISGTMLKTQKCTSRILRSRFRFNQQKQQQELQHNEKNHKNNLAKCLNLSSDSIEEDNTIPSDLSSSSIQKNLFKRPFQLNSSHILNDSKTESNSVLFDRLQIIDVCGSYKLFEEFFKEFPKENTKKFLHLGFSIGVEKLKYKTKPLIGENLLINQNHQMQTAAINQDKEMKYIFDEDYYVVGISICYETNIVYYLNMENDKRDKSITNELLTFKILQLLSNKNLILRIYDAKEQLKILKKIIPSLNSIEAKIEDPKIANWLLQPDNNMHFKSMIQQYAPECCRIADIAGKMNIYSSIALYSRSSIIGKIRSSVESCVVHRILENQIENLKKIDNGQLYKIFTNLEMPIQIALFKMESIGFPVNEDQLKNLSESILNTMKKIENKIYEIHGSKFNLSSTSAVARVLGLHKKSNGKISTSKQILEKIDTPISHLIINYRKLNTTLTKIIQPLIKCMKCDKNRIYGQSFSFTATGRISMHEPNLQNITKNFEIDFLENEKILISCRNCFVPPNGKYLISADFCQLEMRILAHLSQDKCLINAMNSEIDVFTAIASKWNKIPESEVSDKLRNGTKQICYGIIYGMGIKSLSDSLKCTEQEAIIVLDQFHLAYPGIRAYIEKVIKFAKQNGYVETITGRRRYLELIHSTNSTQKGHAERQAINTTIQGSAADISKNAILKMENFLKKHKEKYNNHEKSNENDHNKMKNSSEVNLVLHLHDELIYEVPKRNLLQILKGLKISMENCVKLNVPLEVRLKVGESWGNMRDYKL